MSPIVVYSAALHLLRFDSILAPNSTGVKQKNQLVYWHSYLGYHQETAYCSFSCRKPMQTTFIPDHLEQWDHPTGFDSARNFSGDSDHLHDHYFVAPVSTSRDADILTRSNWDVVTDEILKVARHNDTEIHRFGHWGCGWYEQLLIHKSDTEALKVAEEWCCTLADYPVASDVHYSELQREEAAEYWERMDIKERLKVLENTVNRWAYNVSIFVTRRDELPCDYDGSLFDYLTTN